MPTSSTQPGRKSSRKDGEQAAGAKQNAPGAPGAPPVWTSAAKQGVGTSLGAECQIHFTIGQGILNEIYFPRLDQACTKDFGFIVTAGDGFFSEEKEDSDYEVETTGAGIPLYKLKNTCKGGRYRIEKEIFTDPRTDALLQYTKFIPLQGSLEDYHLYVLLSPHLENHGDGNTAWIDEYKDTPMLFASRGANYLALACSAPWMKRSVGYVGASDGWQDLRKHGHMEWTYPRAEEGNVALTGEIDLSACDGDFILSLGFGGNEDEAGFAARNGLQDEATRARSVFVNEWKSWQSKLNLPTRLDAASEGFCRTSASVVRMHEAAHFPGGIIASLTIPWGFATGRSDLGGYHLVWPRDQIQAAGALLAVGAQDDACRALGYLSTTQEGDGHWPQNMWLNGVPYWKGIQMDEAALPILLVDLAHRDGALDEASLRHYWPVVRAATSFIVQNGPATPQDRWEEIAGFSTSTLAVEIAALVTAAEMADHFGEPDTAQYLRETADWWNESIERWTYVTGTDLANKLGIEGYYVRVSAANPAAIKAVVQRTEPSWDFLRPDLDGWWRHVISPDALLLVRFGLRRPDDPRILNTLKALDVVLKVDTPYGPVWHRYNGDRYGEHPDGGPYVGDGQGVGRAWPLLTGERGHYELAAGRPEKAIEMLKSMERFANEGGLISEQVWDTDDIPEHGLFFGRPTGSAMPLVWAHAEYLKLARSLADGQVYDLPPAAAERYLDSPPSCPFVVWRFLNQRQDVPEGKRLRLEVRGAATVRWSTDDWQTHQDTDTRDTDMGLHVADLPTDDLEKGRHVVFTFYWKEGQQWEGKDIRLKVTGAHETVEAV
ncbi:MAG TPA: glucan 1,4-alpha-glucosidase [Rhodothermales bacterium]|nr:glucan 1,4-alpha-glucosidase [Rhodothermales bacterium]